MKKPTKDIQPLEAAAPKQWHSKRNLLIDAVVILVVIGIVGVIWWIGNRPKTEPASNYPQYSQQQLQTEVNKKYGQNDYNGAINLIKGQKIVNEAGVQLLLAGAYANAGDNKKALEVYAQLDSQGKLQNSDDLATAAEIAQRDKQYQKAIDYYQKAKEHLKASEATVDQAAVYDYKIADLKKKL